jgi:ketosteroid isomerase-like protein
MMGSLEQLIRQMFDAVINDGDIDRVTEFVHPDWVSHTPQGTLSVDGFKGYVRSWRGAFPDIQCEVYDVVESGDTIAWRVRARGTHVGEFMGIPATNRFVDFDSMNFARARDGRPIEHTVMMDIASMLEQLGLPTGPTGAADLIELGYDAFARKDLPAVLAVFRADIVWQTQPTIPILGGRYVGIDAVTEFFMTLPTVYSDFHVEPDRFLESGNDVVVLGHHRGTVAASGESFVLPFAHVWTTEGGLATSFTEYTDSAANAALLTAIPRQEIRLSETEKTTTS